MSRHVLVVRLDSMGDVLVCGPAVRAVAHGSDRTTVLAGPNGAEAARMLPGVDDVLVWRCPWVVTDPPPVDPVEIAGIVAEIRDRGIDEAVVLTSFHQSPLPTALVLRLAGVRHIAAASVDYPGALLDRRLVVPGDAPEPERMLQIVVQAGFGLPPRDTGRLAVRRPGRRALPNPGYVVVHAGASAPARTASPARWAAIVADLTAAGWPVVLTGTAAERPVTGQLHASVSTVRDLTGRLDLPALADLLADASALVTGNTGPAHLAAAVGTPVVSLFSPVVPAVRWAPYGVPAEILGDQLAACRGTRSTTCPVPGHPCLDAIPTADILRAVNRLAGSPARAYRTGIPA
jgi:ADP-heptose:LPS heptosyltransferase